MDQNISIIYDTPNPEEYNALRRAAGLSPRDLSGVKTAMNNSIFTVILRNLDDQLIGMGRIIGDSGCFYQIVDIAVDPAYQGKGYGNSIMLEITKFLDQNAPKDAYVSLIADIPADNLYKKFGFDYTSPKSVGMYKKY